MSGPFPQFRQLIVKPVLVQLEMWSPAAENLVYGTALTESLLQHLKQVGGGPALGLFQMEDATRRDVNRYLARRLDIMDRVRPMAVNWPPQKEELIFNLYVAAAYCRIKYYMDPQPLPAAHDIWGLARCWKRVYNTHLGAGRPEDFVNKAARVVLTGD